jgi:membrane associated rhomboid family serine protease
MGKPHDHLQWRFVTDTIPVCYRHPDRPTRLRCAECGRPICPECSVDTPVGQKCVECARSTTRVIHGRTAVTTLPPVTAALLAINIGLFVLSYYLAPSVFRALEQSNRLIHAGEWWRLVTGAFLHGGLLHIFFNMYALWLFGPQIERQVGSASFATLYFASLLWGSAFFLFMVPSGVAIGASGAIFGLFGAWIGASYRSRHTPMGRRLFQQLIILLVINLALPLFIGGVAWQAHVGGLIAGLLVVWGWQRVGMRRASAAARVGIATAIGGVALVAALLAVLIG